MKSALFLSFLSFLTSISSIVFMYVFFLLLPLPFGLANSGERSYFVVVTDAAVVVLVVVFVSFTLVCVAAFSGAISI